MDEFSRNQLADEMYQDAVQLDHESYTERQRQIRLSTEAYEAGKTADMLAADAMYLRKQSYLVRSGKADG